MADAELGPITVNGDPVEIPDVLSINLDEAAVVYDLYGVSLDEVGTGSSAPRLSILRALLHVGVQRAQPDAKPDDIKVAVGQVQLGTLMAAVREPDAGEGDALPPAFSKSSSGNGASSGRGSVTSSAVPVSVAPSTSGTPGSGTSE